MLKRVLISGSTGFVGKNLTAYLINKNFEVFQLIRKKDGEKSIFWDPGKKLIDQEKIKDFDVVIHLSGEPVTGYWTKNKQHKIYNSRIESTKFLIDTLQRLDAVPKVFITASAIGYYNYNDNQIYSEDSHSGNGFLSQVCEAWEDEASKIMGSRVINLRFGHILGKNGGLLPKLKLIHKLWMGGKLGNGKQYISWIAIYDVVKIVDFIMQNENIYGPVNVVNSSFVTQEEFARMISKLLNKPFFFHIPKFILRLFLGKQADEMLLSSIKAFPKKLKDFNYQFKYENLSETLKHYI
jgi:uncharacterized protein